MYINSPGGVVTSGLAIYDTMQFVRPGGLDAVHRPGGVHGFAAAHRRNKENRVLRCPTRAS